MCPKDKISDEDKAILQQAMKGVKPLKTKSKILFSNNNPTKHIKFTTRTTLDDEPEPILPFSDYEKLDWVSSDQYIEYKSSGFQNKRLRKLREGQYNTDASLDLHGKSIEEAKLLLSKFLIECQQRHFRCVLIIHGKGRDATKAIIKNKLNHWLRETDLIVSFCSAQPKNGGTGALYVLLRRVKVG